MKSIESKSAAPPPVHYLKNDSAITCMTLVDHHNSLYLAEGNVQGYLTLIDMESCEVVDRWQAHNCGCQSVLFLAARSQLLTQGRASQIRLWQLNSRQLLLSVDAPHVGFCRAIALSEDLFVCPGENMSELLTCKLSYSLPHNAPSCVTSRILPAAVAKFGAVMQMCRLAPSSAAADAIFIVAVYESGHAAVWRTGANDGDSVLVSSLHLKIDSGHTPICVTVAKHQLSSENCLPKSKMAAGNSAKGDISSCDGNVSVGAGGDDESECDSNDQLHAVIGTSGHQLLHMLIVSGSWRLQQLESLRLPSAGQSAVCVRRGGRELLAVGCWDGCIRLYSWLRFRQLACLRHHCAPVEVIQFAPRRVCVWNAHRLLISASTDKTTAFWKIYDDCV